ncbi:MAG TPA: glycosyltransferase family 1 protein [Vineibacter sp.]|nr:glycosyltransferase family 1 protein [Vineibacter sp.]
MPNSKSCAGTGRLLDISRLLSRLHRRTPTGIDRAELAYVRHYLDHAEADGREVRFVLTTPLNTGLLRRRLGENIVRSAVQRWCPPVDDPAAEAAYRRLCDILRTPLGADGGHRIITSAPASPDILDKRTEALIAAAYAQATVAGAAVPRLPAARDTLPWYLQASHINLDAPRRLSWLKASGLPSAFLLHDLIPISHPEYFLPGEEGDHRRRMATLARLADVVIFNSKMTGDAWRAHLDATNLPQPLGAVVPLGVEDTFRAGHDGPSPSAVAVPYFVAVGTIEARKNIAFLLHVWRQWTQDGRAPRARLIIIGRRGWESENAFDLLDRSRALASSIIEVAELGDVALAALLRGARALLAPSLVEGFGLPIVEALALGVPVIASDIDAHREVGGSFAEYIDPLDGPGWIAALEDYVHNDAVRRETMRLRARQYRATTWADHIGAVEDLLTANMQQ